jgi:hypothetical protein
MPLSSGNQKNSLPPQAKEMVERQMGPMNVFNADSIARACNSRIAGVVKQDYIDEAVLKELRVAWGDVADDQNPLDLTGTKHPVEFKKLAVLVPHYPNGTVISLLK